MQNLSRASIAFGSLDISRVLKLFVSHNLKCSSPWTFDFWVDNLQRSFFSNFNFQNLHFWTSMIVGVVSRVLIVCGALGRCSNRASFMMLRPNHFKDTQQNNWKSNISPNLCSLGCISKEDGSLLKINSFKLKKSNPASSLMSTNGCSYIVRLQVPSTPVGCSQTATTPRLA